MDRDKAGVSTDQELKMNGPYLTPEEVSERFSKLKALLRKEAQRTVDGLWTTIDVLVDAFTPTECTNYFTACGYDAN